MKRRAIFVLLFLSVCATFCITQFDWQKNEELYVRLKENLDVHQDAMREMISVHQGHFVDKESEAFGAFAAFFDGDLLYADLRDPMQALFSFSALHPETSKRLLYCPDNRPQIMADAFLEADAEEMRIEKLGINQKGYIWCIRLMDGWFYLESYLPT